MRALELQLRHEVERATAGLTHPGPDAHRHVIVVVTRRALARVWAAHGLAKADQPDPLDSPLGNQPELDWAQVDADTLAEVYERLLGLADGASNARGQTPRKRSGTYYTPAALVDRLLDEVLDPLLDHACASPEPGAALLALRVCDPACGSGRFLRPAARRIAARLVEFGGRSRADAIIEVLERCIYGVDLDPLAIELCRLNLALEAGSPASVDRLRCGDALLGAPAEHAETWADADAWCEATLRSVAPERSASDRSPRFFHWSLAYPDVFAAGGFDLVLGNPPWEVLEAEGRGPAAALIVASGRFPRSSAARKNLYALFVELGDSLCSPRGRLGMVVPTEVVQGAIAERLARPWFEARRCAAVYDFQNRPAHAHGHRKPGKWFPDVHPQLRFALLCLAPESESTALCADASTIADTRDPSRVYAHEAAAILRLCPRSFRLPLVRGPLDREAHERAYARGRPLAELLAEPGVVARLLFNFGASERRAKHHGPARPPAREAWVRVYEGEHIHQYNHRYASQAVPGPRPQRVETQRLADPSFTIATATQLPRELLDARLRAVVGTTPPGYLLALRRQARAADAHVGIAAIIPTVATEGSLTCFIGLSGPIAALACATFNSFAFNYLLAGRQTGPNLNRGLLAELPILDHRIAAATVRGLPWITERVLELSYTGPELGPFARACGYRGPPFAWSLERRAQVRVELEAALFDFYGFTVETAGHALDRFTIVARRETREHGEFVTKRQILLELASFQTLSPELA